MTDTKRQDSAVAVLVGRRRFLTWVVASPALVVAARLEAAVAPEETPFDLYLPLRADGRVLTTCPRSEMGQGITPGVPMLVAEELDADLAAVDVRTADAASRWLIQLTGLSSTMRYLAGPLRAAAAHARARLVTAA